MAPRPGGAATSSAAADPLAADPGRGGPWGTGAARLRVPPEATAPGRVGPRGRFRRAPKDEPGEVTPARAQAAFGTPEVPRSCQAADERSPACGRMPWSRLPTCADR